MRRACEELTSQGVEGPALVLHWFSRRPEFLQSYGPADKHRVTISSMTRIWSAALAASLFATGLLCHGQQARSSALQPLAFLSGRWVSEEPGEMQEENWLPVSGESMVGSFRIVRRGKPVFYEFWAVEVDENRPVLKLKHFNADLAGWEEKDSSTKMPLTSISPDDAVFAEPDGSVSLHYHRSGDRLTCVVHHVRNGQASDETFALTRVPNL
jgi:hypothetical protein